MDLYRPTTGEATWRSKRKEGLDHSTGSIAVETLKTHALLFMVMLKNYSRVPRDDDDGSRSAPIDPVGSMELIESLLYTYLPVHCILPPYRRVLCCKWCDQPGSENIARQAVHRLEGMPTNVAVGLWHSRSLRHGGILGRSAHSLSLIVCSSSAAHSAGFVYRFPLFLYTYLPETDLVGNCSICIYLTSADSIPFFHSTDYTQTIPWSISIVLF